MSRDEFSRRTAGSWGGPTPTPALESRIEAVRRFSRFYTHKIGILPAEVSRNPFSLTEVRVLYELAHRAQPTATELGADLGLDAGYLSRILQGFAKRGLLNRSRSSADARQSLLTLTAKGKKAFAPIEARAIEEVGAMLRELPIEDQDRLVGALETVEKLLSGRAGTGPAYIFRSHQPGDMGWVVHRHGVLYAQEYGCEFEAMIAEAVAHFIQNYDAKRERCWIAERNGESIGCVFVVKHAKTVAKLRLLLVEPKARGLGIGRRLVEECVRFARQVGYRKMVLWTQSELLAARHLYKQAGFRVARRELHHIFGKDLVAETWELNL